MQNLIPAFGMKRVDQPIPHEVFLGVGTVDTAKMRDTLVNCSRHTDSVHILHHHRFRGETCDDRCEQYINGERVNTP